MGSRLFIDIGEVHGVRAGEEYEVYECSAALGLGPDKVVAKIVIDRVGGLRSAARMPAESSNVVPGYLVRLLTPVLVSPINVRVHSAQLLKALQEVLWSTEESGMLAKFIPLGEEGDAVFQVLSPDGHYQIADGSANPITNCPSVPTDGEVARKLYEILQSLARFRMVAELHNKKSSLTDMFTFRFCVSGSVNATEQTGTTEVLDGGIVEFEFENLSDQILYYTAFDLTPRWAVNQLIPSQTDVSLSVEPRTTSNPIEIEMEIPEALRDDVIEIEDMFKSDCHYKPKSV
jgi:hypothetical protein